MKFESDWDHLKAICEAANSGNQPLVSDLILAIDTDAVGVQLIDAAVTAFDITPENMSKHREAAAKLAAAPQGKHLGFRSAIRQSMIGSFLAGEWSEKENPQHL